MAPRPATAASHPVCRVCLFPLYVERRDQNTDEIVSHLRTRTVIAVLYERETESRGETHIFGLENSGSCACATLIVQGRTVFVRAVGRRAATAKRDADGATAARRPGPGRRPPRRRGSARARKTADTRDSDTSRAAADRHRETRESPCAFRVVRECDAILINLIKRESQACLAEGEGVGRRFYR